jgi:hypothetical protein
VASGRIKGWGGLRLDDGLGTSVGEGGYLLFGKPLDCDFVVLKVNGEADCMLALAWVFRTIRLALGRLAMAWEGRRGSRCEDKQERRYQD